jgi:D-sedoheptulose 7-phosphate isomerase
VSETVQGQDAARTAAIASACDEIAANFAALKALAPRIAQTAAMWSAALRSGGRVLFCGNGGSAADAQHLAAELSGRFEMNRPAMAGLALTTDTSALTAIANDFGYESVFARQVEAMGRPGDVLYAISTSGNSPNVLAAAEAARARGMSVVGVTGLGGGKLAGLSDVLLDVPASKAARVQELHIAMGHMVCGIVEGELNG